MRRMFRAFETWINPFAAIPKQDLPDEIGPFILYFLRQTRWPFVVFMVLGGVVGLIEASLFYFVGLLIDTLKDATPASIWAEHGWMLLGMAFVVLVVRTLALTASTLINNQTLEPSFFALVRWQSHRRVLRQSYRFFQDDFAGRIATKVMQSGQSLGDFLINLIQSIWFFTVFSITSIGLFAALDWRLAVLLAIWFTAYFGILAVTLPEVRRRSKIRSHARSSLNGRIVDSYTNIQTVKLFAGTDNEDLFGREALETMLTATHDYTRLVSGLRIALSVINGLLITAAGYLAIWLWSSGTITVGAIAVTLALVLRINNMSGWMMFQFNGIFRDLGTLQDAISTVSLPIEVRDRTAAKPIANVVGDIHFDNVRFHYGQQKGAIEKLDLNIRSGEKVGIVGRSGAGKTTMMNLLLRLYEPESGRILIDGNDIADVTQDSLRRNIGVVTQDTSLLHRSIRDNIAYGSPSATEQDVIAAARRAHAHEFIEDVQDSYQRKGYKAHVGERGVKLSGGQRQRIAIARVFLKNAPILMMDEATSSLDSEVEAAIQEHLLSLMEGKTVIAIAHRLSTIAHLDRLIVLNDGIVVEDGTHDTLIGRGGLYADLWARQSGGFLPTAEAAE
ncbi:MAG: ATP-binding cassette subfamily B multidrug efflux pump [Hyphomicrobiaceae bacterium]|jgi:ATP-binding cassette subfamily B multidrug efflux pump